MEEILRSPVEGAVVFPILYKVLYIPGGCLGFLPSTATVHSADSLNLDPHNGLQWLIIIPVSLGRNYSPPKKKDNTFHQRPI